MDTTKVSPKYQVVIPKRIRESMGLQVGETFQVLRYGDRIELIPLKPMKKMRGFLKGMDTHIKREEDRF